MLRILAFADLHFWEREELLKVKDYDFDICVLLGDIPYTAIQEIIKIVKDKPIFGVPGNHDTWDLFEHLPVINLHGRTEKYLNVTFAGIGGSSKYKNGPYAMLTQEESVDILKEVPKADILFSHDCMLGLFGEPGSSHGGLLGIKEYIYKHQVSLNVCGHHHMMIEKESICLFSPRNGPYIRERIKNLYRKIFAKTDDIHFVKKRNTNDEHSVLQIPCKTVCVYRCALITYPLGLVEPIF